MSDYHFSVDILRDQVASQLADRIEQTPYVLAEMAGRISIDGNFDDFMDSVRGLDDDQQMALLTFCNAVSLSLSEDTD